MTDENESTPGEVETDASTEVEQIVAHMDNWNEFIRQTVPAQFQITRDLLAFYNVYTNAEGVMDPPRDELEKQLLAAVVKLEGNFLILDARLKQAGL